MEVSKLELIAALEKEEVVYADRSLSHVINMVEFTFDNNIDLGFFHLSCDNRGYVKCYIENDKISHIEATTCETEVPDDVTTMD